MKSSKVPFEESPALGSSPDSDASNGIPRRPDRLYPARAVPLRRTLGTARLTWAAAGSIAAASATFAATATRIGRDHINVDSGGRFSEFHHHHHSAPLRLQIVDRGHDAADSPTGRASGIRELLVAARTQELVEKCRRFHSVAGNFHGPFRHFHFRQLEAERLNLLDRSFIHLPQRGIAH